MRSLYYEVPKGNEKKSREIREERARCCWIFFFLTPPLRNPHPRGSQTLQTPIAFICSDLYKSLGGIDKKEKRKEKKNNVTSTIA